MNVLKNALLSSIGTIVLASCNFDTQTTEVAQTAPTPNPDYQEAHRPQFHFSPDSMWMNDPNGMVYFDGEYHLFYQYYPDSTVWGPMHWGHAVSPDLVHWEHLPIALYPDSLGYIFSGSAVVDWNNSSGFGIEGQPPLVAMFTYHNPEAATAGRNDVESQAIAYSNDRGRSWAKYTGNPVVPNTALIRDFRDPKMIWDASSEQWLMVLAAQDRVKIFGSKDLKQWDHLSDFGEEYGSHGGVWECPDLFPIQVEGSEEEKWVLLLSINPGSVNGGSGTQYFIGDFDGQDFVLDERFRPFVEDEKALWVDYGHDNYAGVTWSDIPKADGRRIFLGWMSNWDYAQVVPTQEWRSAMTIARELHLRKTPAGYRLYSQPVNELKVLRQDSLRLESQSVEGVLDISRQLPFTPELTELILEFKLEESTASDISLRLANERGESYTLGYEVAGNRFYSDRTKSGKTGFSDKFAASAFAIPRQSTDSILRLHLFIDISSIELFSDDGSTVATEIFFPNEPFNQLSIFAAGGAARLESAHIYQLRSIW